MNAPLPGCLCHPEQALSLRRCANPCNSFRPALPSPALPSSVAGTLALGASYSAPVYLLPSVRPSAPLAVPCLRQVIVSAIRVVFVLFVFVYFFAVVVVVAVPGQALFVLCLASWIFMLLLSGFVFLYVSGRRLPPPAFVSFRFSPLILWLPLSRCRGRGGARSKETDDGEGESDCESEASARP